MSSGVRNLWERRPTFTNVDIHRSRNRSQGNLILKSQNFMTLPIQVLEAVTPDNLYPRGYLLANADLKNAFGTDEAAARKHFSKCGLHESRRQLTPEFIEWSNDPQRKAERFQRFKSSFSSLPPDVANFPISFGDRCENVTDYQSESAHPTASSFAEELATHPDKLYADIGAGLRDRVFANCLYVEVYPSLTTDVVIEAKCELPFANA